MKCKDCTYWQNGKCCNSRSQYQGKKTKENDKCEYFNQSKSSDRESKVRFIV